MKDPQKIHIMSTDPLEIPGEAKPEVDAAILKLIGIVRDTVSKREPMVYISKKAAVTIGTSDQILSLIHDLVNKLPPEILEEMAMIIHHKNNKNHPRSAN